MFYGERQEMISEFIIKMFFFIWSPIMTFDLLTKETPVLILGYPILIVPLFQLDPAIYRWVNGRITCTFQPFQQYLLILSHSKGDNERFYAKVPH